MKDKLLSVIKDLELLRAEALVDGNTQVVIFIDDSLLSMYWAYKDLDQYE